MQTLADGIRTFLHDWQFADDGIWRQVNPTYQPLTARSREGLIALLRISVPAIGSTRSARVADAIREAGYQVIEVDGLYSIQRNTQSAVAVA